MARVIVIGGGAAGMMAAIWAARTGGDVMLLEKNEKLGKKLFLTGKGRCNLTNACDTEELFLRVVTNPKFLYSGFYSFDSHQVMEFFEALGLRLKVERGNRVFPASDHSSDVIKVLERELRRLSVDVRLHTEVQALVIENEEQQGAGGSPETDGKAARALRGVRLAGGEILPADRVIVATGGLSYPQTGSTGDGYRFASACGHEVKPCFPSLVPIATAEPWCKELMGLSLRNVTLRAVQGKKVIYEEFGELLFTHFGVSGPLVLSASAYLHRYLGKPVTLFLDLKPALTAEQLDARILRDFDKQKNKQFQNALDLLLPKRMIPVLVRASGIPAEKRVHEVTRAERAALADAIKHLPLTVTGLRGYEEAIITKGGISVKQVNPSTMESKLVSGLYYAGEALDVDALTGGFNLQIAWSTGYLAGVAAGKEIV